MFESLKTWLAANHQDVFFYGLLLFTSPTVAQIVFRPKPGTKAHALLGTLSAWGLDADKFFRKWAEFRAKSGPPRGCSRLDAMATSMVPGLLLACLAGNACGKGQLPPEVAEVRDAAELVLHVADAGCPRVVALTHDDSATAICLGVHELAQLDEHLKTAEIAEADAPLVLVAKDETKRKVRVRREHVKAARASVARARDGAP